MEYPGKKYVNNSLYLLTIYIRLREGIDGTSDSANLGAEETEMVKQLLRNICVLIPIILVWLASVAIVGVVSVYLINLIYDLKEVK